MPLNDQELELLKKAFLATSDFYWTARSNLSEASRRQIHEALIVMIELSEAPAE